jgi:diacylglycerol O-acyltransferase / wax synthase
MERLSGMDATFLYIETPKNQTHMTGVLVFDPSTMPGGYSFDKMRSFVRSRLVRSPAFTRKLARVPFNLAHPVWVEDPDFDMEAHIHRVAVPSPGGPRELGDMAGDIAGRPLDRSRPLWEMWFVEGLEHGRAALVAKMHHATIDGVSGANLMMHLFDLEPEPIDPVPLPPLERPDHVPNDLELIGYGLWSRVRRPLLLPGALAGTAKAGVELVRRRTGPNRGGTARGGMATPFSAPPTPFNGPITPHRRVAFTTVPLSDVRGMKDHFGTTVNDVILALSAGAVRGWLQRHDTLPAKPLIAGVPVSTRGEEEAAFGANLISAMFVSLATDLDDPVDRLLAIREATKGAKEEFNAVGADVLSNWTEFTGPGSLGLAIRMYSQMELADRHPPALNFLVSNVPGPPIPLYFAGGRLEALYPLGPIFDGMGLNITVLSYMDEVGFGFLACREMFPDLWELADGVVTELDELRRRAKAKARLAAPAKPRRAAKAKSPSKVAAKSPAKAPSKGAARSPRAPAARSTRTRPAPR